MSDDESAPPAGGLGGAVAEHGSPRMLPPDPPRSGLGVWPAIVLIIVAAGAMVVFLARRALDRHTEHESRTHRSTVVLREIGRSAKERYAIERKVCPSATQLVPQRRADLVLDMRYQSSAGDWSVDRASHAGFACLGFELTAPQSHRFEYVATSDGFRARAYGRSATWGTLEIRGRETNGGLEISDVEEIPSDTPEPP
jgi:hypothetical protein